MLLPTSVLGVTKTLVTQLTVTPEKIITKVQAEHTVITPSWQRLAGKGSASNHIFKSQYLSKSHILIVGTMTVTMQTLETWTADFVDVYAFTLQFHWQANKRRLP